MHNSRVVRHSRSCLQAAALVGPGLDMRQKFVPWVVKLPLLTGPWLETRHNITRALTGLALPYSLVTYANYR
ncbi:hypothetical protein CDV36_016514 [Fusarium kuroshium]|uniref:Uncharacterized protein n=1 Tax=Fusarium kuroshium TaxID=2010991 RepID=A0A3M2QLK3_9HYPO|nr:hypothetical protein CDV36_016514 [Fusarium kuroshium]